MKFSEKQVLNERHVSSSINICSSNSQPSGFVKFRKWSFLVLFIFLIAFGGIAGVNKSSNEGIYPSIDQRKISPEDITYFIDPVKGDDNNSGTDKSLPWRTFRNLNGLILTKGNKVHILSPGELRSSLFVVAKGTKKSPVKIEFAPGRYNFFPEQSVKRKFFISNTNDAPESLKSIAIYILKSKNIKIDGKGADFIFRGKVMETVVDSSENVKIENINFDYLRPTVSEMKIISVSENSAIAEIHKDSKYKIEKNTLIWVGEGWEHSVHNLWQVFNPNTDELYRKGFPVKRLNFTELSPGKVRIDFTVNPGFKTGLIYQNRNTFRDYAANFTRNSKNIQWKNVNVYFMHGMGFVSQFSENITFEDLKVAPRAGSGRTCAAWADILHFSGCKGNIRISNCLLSAANDDAVNVHGTHLRIIDKISEKKLKVRFMHGQTYGFIPFYPGDSVEFINEKTLLPIAANIVSDVKELNSRDYEITFKDPVPQDVHNKNVIENVTWIPDVDISKTVVKHIPTRGILVTTSGKVVIRNNKFYKTEMSSILIADDANSWYESGYVKDVTIRNNKFIECGRPVINIHPENSVVKKGKYVHKNIRISDNYFLVKKLPVLAAKSTSHITFTGNIIEGSEKDKVEDVLSLRSCKDVKTEGNKLKEKK